MEMALGPPLFVMYKLNKKPPHKGDGLQLCKANLFIEKGGKPVHIDRY